jgi:hypothetical protein
MRTVFLFIFTLACLGTIIFQCLPVRAIWEMDLQPPFGNARCYSNSVYRSIGLFNGCTFSNIGFSAQVLTPCSNQHLHRRFFRIASDPSNSDFTSQRSHEGYLDCDLEHWILVRGNSHKLKFVSAMLTGTQTQCMYCFSCPRSSSGELLQ